MKQKYIVQLNLKLVTDALTARLIQFFNISFQSRLYSLLGHYPYAERTAKL